MAGCASRSCPQAANGLGPALLVWRLTWRLTWMSVISIHASAREATPAWRCCPPARRNLAVCSWPSGLLGGALPLPRGGRKRPLTPDTAPATNLRPCLDALPCPRVPRAHRSSRPNGPGSGRALWRRSPPAALCPARRPRPGSSALQGFGDPEPKGRLPRGRIIHYS